MTRSRSMFVNMLPVCFSLYVTFALSNINLSDNTIGFAEESLIPRLVNEQNEIVTEKGETKRVGHNFYENPLMRMRKKCQITTKYIKKKNGFRR